MADKKTQMDKVREAYVKAQANKDEDRLTQADLEKLKEFAKKNRGKIFQKTDQKPVYLKDEGEDLPMSKEGSPTVTDTETGKVTYGKPEKFEHGGMASCRGMGKAIKGGKFIGVK
jgi:hypothetical protein